MMKIAHLILALAVLIGTVGQGAAIPQKFINELVIAGNFTAHANITIEKWINRIVIKPFVEDRDEGGNVSIIIKETMSSGMMIFSDTGYVPDNGSWPVSQGAGSRAYPYSTENAYKFMIVTFIEDKHNASQNSSVLVVYDVAKENFSHYSYNQTLINEQVLNEYRGQLAKRSRSPFFTNLCEK